MNGPMIKKSQNSHVSTKTSGFVFDIQRFSLDDGPGIRTAVFLKGCPLRCVWCSNPESQKLEPELAYFSSNCVLCAQCVKNCPEKALTVGKEKILIDRRHCTVCGECEKHCNHGALQIIGKKMSVSEVIAEVLRDRPFYEESGGGITITGGEPLFQADFTASLLQASRKEMIGTAIETCGFGSRESFQKIVEYTDIVLFDVKLISEDLSSKYTGVTSEGIIQNLKTVDSLGKDIYIRFPLIPGYTDTEENLFAIAGLVKSLQNVIEIDILPFHQYGKHKYSSLGYEYPLEDKDPIQRDDAGWVTDFFEEKNIRVKLFGQ